MRCGQDGLAGQDKSRSLVSFNDGNGRLVEAVVSCGSAAVGVRPDAGFGAAYGGIVVAVHRHGVRLLSHGSVALQAGDALLVLTTDAFLPQYTRDETFASVRLVTSYKPRRSFTPLLGMVSLLLMMALSPLLNAPQLGDTDLLRTAMYGMAVTAATGCAASQADMRWG